MLVTRKDRPFPPRPQGSGYPTDEFCYEKFSGQQVPAQSVMTRWRWEIKQLHSVKVRDPQTLVSGIATAQTEGRKYIASELAHCGVPDRVAAQVAHQTEKTWTDFPELGICTLLREIY